MSGKYSADHIYIMWVIAAEIASHIAVTRGDVAMVVGTNPSGNALTVFINNIVNGLRVRSFFYATMPESVRTRMCGRLGDFVCPYEGQALGGIQIPSGLSLSVDRELFSDYVRAGFYGDDFSLSPVPEIVSWFNQVAMGEYFSSIGKVITAADKGPITRPLTPWSQASFLKRGFVYHDDLAAVVGPLEVTSIFKSLFYWKKKMDLSPQSHLAVLAEGIIRELVLHGRSVYDKYIVGLVRMLDEFGARSYLPADVSYEAAVCAWRNRHSGQVGQSLGFVRTVRVVGPTE